MRNYTQLYRISCTAVPKFGRAFLGAISGPRGTYSLLSHRGLAVAYRPLTRTVAAGGAWNGYCGHD